MNEKTGHHFLDNVPSTLTSQCDDKLYEARDIATHSTRIHSLGEQRGLLALHQPDEFHVEFALYAWAQGCPAEGTNHYSIVFHGCGPSGNLREMRHTWWGDDGYLFYAPRTLIVEAFELLDRWFDR